jgi:hypothetical protein
MITIEIDQLTNSIENAFTGERFLTEALLVNKHEIVITEYKDC